MTSEVDSKFLRGILNVELIGWVVTDVGDADEEGFFDIILRESTNLSGPKMKLTPSCDPEGNGPGWLFMEIEL